MQLDHVTTDSRFLEAFREHERQERLNTGKTASALVVFLMPAGALLDYFVFVYRNPAGDWQRVEFFFQLRLLCSLIVGVIWYLHKVRSAERYCQFLMPFIALLPAFFISWMIYDTRDPQSDYYAGLNLVILAVSVVVRWGVTESMLVASAIFGMWLAAGFLTAEPMKVGAMFNNAYFMVLTAIIVVTGNHFYSRLRFREFALRYQLDQSRARLEETNRQLRELDELKSRFFANISHELRTPLTLLIAPLENLIHKFNARFDDDTRQVFSTMHSNAMRLLKLINDLLDLVRLESGRTVLKNVPIDVKGLLAGLASAAGQVAAQKNLRIETEVPPDVGAILADRDKIEKILLNLQFNAIKFTPAGGSIAMRARKDGSNVVFQVSDTGVGIAQDKLPKVFSRFFQADDSSQRKYQGVGIGLALVKELAEVMGGSVHVESELDKGSTFTVCLPYLAASECAPPPARDRVGEPAAADGRGGQDEWLIDLYRRAELTPAMSSQQLPTVPVAPDADDDRALVLVADDESDMRRFLARQVAGKYRVAEAADGVQALETALHLRPSLILLDMMMPEKDGLQVCRELREHPETRTTPVIMLTARADEETKLRALSSGANDYLTKPFVTAELEARVQNLIVAAEYQQQLSEQNIALSDALARLKDAESELVQTEKLASLGRLSAGIIHEINNPLNYASTGLFTLRGKARHLAPESRDEYLGILRDVEEGLQRVTTIVSDLRAFAHRENSAVEPVDVADVVQSTLRFLSHELKGNVRVLTNLPDGLSVSANRNKLIQVLINLVQNSIDALAGKSFADGEPTIWIEGRSEHGKTVLSVRDNGEGIEKDNLDKIFDPFFTTKDVGEGMGLGLSICYRIVQEFQGRITARSERGRFCEFSIEFPEPDSAPIAVARTA